MEIEAYPSDVTDDEWGFVAPYLTLMTEEAPQREHDLREVFNGLRWIVRAGASWLESGAGWSDMGDGFIRWITHSTLWGCNW